MLEKTLPISEVEKIKNFLPKGMKQITTLYKNAGVPVLPQIASFEEALYSTIVDFFPNGFKLVSIEHHSVVNRHINNIPHVDIDDSMKEGKEYWTVVWYFTNNNDSPLLITFNDKNIRVDPKIGKIVAFPSNWAHQVPVVKGEWRSSVVAILELK